MQGKDTSTGPSPDTCLYVYSSLRNARTSVSFTAHTREAVFPCADRSIFSDDAFTPHGHEPPHSHALSTNLWLLSLASRNSDLMQMVARLFLQFNLQYQDLCSKHQQEIQKVREHHMQQLSSLLDADATSAKDIIVSSSITQSVVIQQQAEIDFVVSQCQQRERAYEVTLQHHLYTVLRTSAVDALASAAATTTSPRAGATGVPCYCPEVDMSHFAWRPNTVSSVPVPTVPVRTVLLLNPLWQSEDLLDCASGNRRPGGAIPQDIVVDVSPTACLKDCLLSCTRQSPSVGSAAEEHLMRLAHAKQSMLLLIGPERLGIDVIHCTDTPELLLGTCSAKTGFSPLQGHPSLKVHFNTRLWGANIVLLWTPPAAPASSPGTSTAGVGKRDPLQLPRPVVEDALRLAFSWQVDMFSVAVLAPGPHSPPSVGRGESPREHPFGDDSGSVNLHGTSSLISYMLSMDVLRQLQHGLAAILMEFSSSRSFPQLWTELVDEVLSQKHTTDQGTKRGCPRAVGVRYAQGPLNGRDTSANSSFPSAAERTPNTAVGRGGSSFSPQVLFNTPMAIRAFLNIPPKFFAQEGEELEPVDREDTSLSGSVTHRPVTRRQPPAAPSTDRRSHSPLPASVTLPRATRVPLSVGSNQTWPSRSAGAGNCRTEPAMDPFGSFSSDARARSTDDTYGEHPSLGQILFYAFRETVQLC